MLTIAINSGSIHNAFFYDQETYIEKFIDYTKSYTNLDDLNNSGIKFFDDSEDISERTYETLVEDLIILDFESLRDEAMAIIEDITDESDDEIINEEIDDLDEENEDFDDLLDSDDDEEE